MNGEPTLKVRMPFYNGAMFLCAMLLSGLGMALPRFSEKLNFSLAQQGALVSVQYIGFFAAVIAAAVLADRFGKMIILRISLLGSSAAAMLFFVIADYAMAVSAILMIGVFGSVLESDLTAIAVLDKERGTRNNMAIHLFFSLGAALLPLVIYACIAFDLPWNLPYLLVGAGFAAAFVLSFRQRGVDVRGTLRFADIGAQFALLFKRPTRLIAPAVMFLYLMAEIGLWTFMPAYIESGRDNLLISTLCILLIWLCMALGRFVTMKLVGGMNITRLMLLYSVGAIASLLMAVLLDGVWLLLAAAVAGFMFAPFFSLIISWMVCLTGTSSGSMVAVTIALGTLGPVTSGWLTGMMVDALGTRAMMYPPLCAFVLIFVVLLLFRNIEEVKRA